MTKAYRAEVRERLKNCVGARLSAEALVIALAGGRIGQSDWSIECDRIISLLDDDADYKRGYEDGLKANTRAAFAAAKQAMSVRTCKLERHGSLANYPEMVCWSCSECHFGWHHSVNDKQFSYCPNCGAKIVARDEVTVYAHDGTKVKTDVYALCSTEFDEIVRCKDCRFAAYEGKECMRIDERDGSLWFPVKPEGFCAWGEKEEA